MSKQKQEDVFQTVANERNTKAKSITKDFVSESNLDNNLAKAINVDLFNNEYNKKKKVGKSIHIKYGEFCDLLKGLQGKQLLIIPEVEFLGKCNVALLTSDNFTKFSDDLTKAVESEEMTEDQAKIEKTNIAKFVLKKVQLEKGFGTVYVSDPDIEKAISGLNNKVLKVETLKDDSKVEVFVEKTKQQVYYENLEKGEISEKLSYGYGAGSEPFKFTKTGKEIKALLPKITAKLEFTKEEVELKMAECIVAAGAQPSEAWNIAELKLSLNRYPYDFISTKYDDINRCYSTPTEQQTAASQYNDLCYTFRSIAEDLKTCKILLTNLEDDKKFNLSVSQLVALGVTGDENLSKGEEDELEKGGEGSRGGKIVGHDKMGKPIYENKNSTPSINHKSFRKINDSDDYHDNAFEDGHNEDRADFYKKHLGDHLKEASEADDEKDHDVEGMHKILKKHGKLLETKKGDDGATHKVYEHEGKKYIHSTAGEDQNDGDRVVTSSKK